MNDQLEANKKIIREWNELAINQRKPEEAVAKYLGTNYRQHNPGAADGTEPFIAAVKGLTEILGLIICLNRSFHNVATSNPSYN